VREGGNGGMEACVQAVFVPLTHAGDVGPYVEELL
jgi:hypothetical protein